MSFLGAVAGLLGENSVDSSQRIIHCLQKSNSPSSSQNLPSLAQSEDHKRPMNQERKKSTKIEFLDPETARWGGGLPREGVVAEKFVPSLESLSSLGFEERILGRPGNFAGMSRTPGGVQKVSAKKFVCIFRSLMKPNFMLLRVGFMSVMLGVLKFIALKTPQIAVLP